MSAYQNLLFSNREGVVRISLNRPSVHNALSSDLIREITEAIYEAGEDATVRVILLTGEGEKSFCAGADLKAAMESGKTAGEMLRDGYNPMIEAIRNIPVPVICRLNGLAVGAGCSLALACDLVIANEDSYLSQIFVHIGLMPDAGASFFLPRLIGTARAFELASTGRKIFAPEAAQIGLINRSVPGEKLDEMVEETISYYRHAPTKAIGAMKKVFNQSFQSNLTQMLNLKWKIRIFYIIPMMPPKEFHLFYKRKNLIIRANKNYLKIIQNYFLRDLEKQNSSPTFAVQFKGRICSSIG